MQHDSGLVGDFAVREGSRVALLLLVEDSVFGQQHAAPSLPKTPKRISQRASLPSSFWLVFWLYIERSAVVIGIICR